MRNTAAPSLAPVRGEGGAKRSRRDAAAGPRSGPRASRRECLASPDRGPRASRRECLASPDRGPRASRRECLASPTRATRMRNAPPSADPLASSPSTSNAASLSRASNVSRTATSRESIGAPSSTTSAKAPLRSNTSAHHAPRSAFRGRTIHSPSCAPSDAHSRGARVRVASTYATHAPSHTARSTMRRTNDVLPHPGAPSNSVSRPRGSPPPGNTPSSAAIPVASPGVPGLVPSMTCASCWRSAASDIGKTEKSLEHPAREMDIPNKTRRCKGGVGGW